MFSNSTSPLAGVAPAIIVTLIMQTVSAQILKATYRFDGNLAADETGVPALAAIDPPGASSGFEIAKVFGQLQTVYHFDADRTSVNGAAGLVAMSPD